MVLASVECVLNPPTVRPTNKRTHILKFLDLELTTCAEYRNREVNKSPVAFKANLSIPTQCINLLLEKEFFVDTRILQSCDQLI